MAEPKNPFDFGTGSIDKDQWLRDIDNEQDAFISRYSEAVNKHRATLLRDAFTDLRRRIANGDMLNRTADGLYQFGSALNREDKHMEEAYRRALGFMGDLARKQIQAPPPEPEKKALGSLEERFIKYLNPSGKLNSEAYWKNQTDDERKESLLKFLNKELGEVDNYQDFGGFETAQTYKDRLNNVLGLFNSGKINDNSLQQLGFTRNWITLPISEELEEEGTKSDLELQELALNLQIEQFTREQSLAEKLQLLTWALDAVTLASNPLKYDTSGVNTYNLEGDIKRLTAGKEQKEAEALINSYLNKNREQLNSYFNNIGVRYQSLYNAGEGSRGVLRHNLNKLFAIDKEGKYVFEDIISKYFSPIGKGRFLVNGTQEENDRLVYYTPDKGFEVRAHNNLYPIQHKEGGVIRYLGGGLASDLYNLYLGPSLEEKTLQILLELLTKSRDPFENWTTGDYTLLGSAAADIASAAASYVPGGLLVSGILGAGSTLASSAVDFKRDNFGSGLTNLVLGLGADVAGMLPVVGTAAKTAKIAKTISKLSKVLVPTFTAMGASSALGATKKLITGESLTPLEWQDLALGVQLIMSGGAKGIAGHRNSAFKRTQAEGVTHYDVKLEDGTMSRITKEEFEGAKRNDYKGTAKQNIFGQVKGKPVVTREGIEKANNLIASESLNPFNSATERLTLYMLNKTGSQGYYIKNWAWPEWTPIQDRLKKILKRKLELTLPVTPERNLSNLGTGTSVALPNGTSDKKKSKSLTEELKLKRKEAAALRKLKKQEAAAKLLALRQLQGLAFHDRYYALPFGRKLGETPKALRNGGIIKAQEGLKTDGLTNKYDNISNWTKLNFGVAEKLYFPGFMKARYDNRGNVLYPHSSFAEQEEGEHFGDLSTISAYDALLAYYLKDNGSHIFGDVLNAYNTWKSKNNGTVQDFINYYNEKVDWLRSWGLKKLLSEANSGGWKLYNLTFNDLYSNYSPYDPKLEDTIGESTWQRTPNTFKGITDLAELRLGILGIGDGATLVAIDNLGHLITDNLINPKGDIKEIKKENDKELASVADSEGGDKTIFNTNFENPIDPTPFIVAGKTMTGLMGNKNVYGNLIDEIPQAPLRDPINRQLAIVGWQERIKSGQNQLADLRRIQQMLQGSDQQTNFATALETDRTGRDIMDKAFQEDSGRQFETAQKLWNLKNEDVMYNTQVSDANRRAIADRARMIAQIRAAWRSGNNNILMGALSDTGNWLLKKYQREQDIIDLAREQLLGTKELFIEDYIKLKNPNYEALKAEYETTKDESRKKLIATLILEMKVEALRTAPSAWALKIYSNFHTPGFGGGYKETVIPLSKDGSKLEIAKLKARSKDNDRYVSMIKDLRTTRSRRRRR